MAPAKKIKTEPSEYEESYALAGPELLSFALDGYKSPPPTTKHTSSPAQEATRARIGTCEGQLKKLYRQRAAGKLDSKGSLQIRCLEEDLRKAHAKLRRLLNEAERQRRRRERLRCGLAPQAPRALAMIVRGSGGRHDDEAPGGCHDDGVMAALKQCTRFEEFVRELNTIGFTLSRVGEEGHVVYDVPEGENAADGEVRVQVELLEGEAALEQQQQAIGVDGDAEGEEIKTEPLSPPPSSPAPSEGHHRHRSGAPTATSRSEVFVTADAAPDGSSLKSPDSSVKTFAGEYARKHALCLREWQEQYQEWYERQLESQQSWEETLMREQMELTKTMLESVTSTFLQGMQQILQNAMSSIGRRSAPPFLPAFAARAGLELNGLNINQSDLPLFVGAEVGNGPTVLSTRSLSEDPSSR